MKLTTFVLAVVSVLTGFWLAQTLNRDEVSIQSDRYQVVAMSNGSVLVVDQRAEHISDAYRQVGGEERIDRQALLPDSSPAHPVSPQPSLNAVEASSHLSEPPQKVGVAYGRDTTASVDMQETEPCSQGTVTRTAPAGATARCN
jgi:hypothetical protein